MKEISQVMRAGILIEDYFLGKIPEKVKNECRNNKPNISFE